MCAQAQRQLAERFTQIQGGLTAVERIGELLEEPAVHLREVVNRLDRPAALQGPEDVPLRVLIPAFITMASSLEPSIPASSVNGLAAISAAHWAGVRTITSMGRPKWAAIPFSSRASTSVGSASLSITRLPLASRVRGLAKPASTAMAFSSAIGTLTPPTLTPRPAGRTDPHLRHRRARPLARVIQDSIKKPLADDILFGRLTRGGHVKVQLKDGKIDFDIKSAGGVPAKSEEEETA